MTSSRSSSRVTTRRGAIATLGAGLGWLATGAWAQGGAKADRMKVRLGIISALFDAPSLIALEKGYFLDEGLDVELKSFASGPDEYQAQATGVIDVAASSVNVALFNARVRGVELSVVAGAGVNAPGRSFSSLVLRKDLVTSGRYKTPSDLKGMKIATGITSAPHWLTAELARRAGLQMDDVQYVGLGIANIVAGMTNGAVDGASVVEPFGTLLLERAGGVRVASADQVFPNSPAGYLVYGPALTVRNVEAGNRFMQAYLKGVRDYGQAFGPAQKDKDAILAILRKYNIDIRPDTPMMSIPEDGVPSMESVEAFLDWQVKLGTIRTRIDPKSLRDDRFRQAALARRR
ncbi:Putative aliphatic sulfonates-binding protein [Cupriavidus laharis]|uniref:Aliphatic sulfonates-binding protein n=1 Tax=Cupriavidus laharis TaxID=151654 RepID=A0ABN7YLZ8_9BURK|nr:ABC transporter substrate-binding protein [Cupriavidus laharis]CAG9173421.1 Putative aliphatic sulfonates-binding protein [Cupriavidus laharis]